MARKQHPRKVSPEDATTVLRERFGGRLAPPLEGLACRFTIWLPVQAKGRPVFSGEQRVVIYALRNRSSSR